MTTNNKQPRWLVILLFIGIVSILYMQWPAIQNVYIVDDDWRQYYWMERFVNPDAFAGDWILENVKQVQTVNILGTTLYLQYESWGFSLIYWLGSFFVEPILFNKILPIGLMLISIFYLYRYGRLISNSYTTFLLVLIFIVYSLSATPNISLLPGLERSFSFPLLIIFLYYFRQGSSVGIIASLAIQTIIYFPIFVVCAAAYAFSLIVKKGHWPTLTLDMQRWLPLLIGVALGFLFFLPAFLRSTEATLSYTADIPIWENPYYGQNGRIPIFWHNPEWRIPLFFIIGYGGFAIAEGINRVVPLVLLFLLMLAALGVRHVKLPSHTRLLLWAALASFGLVWLVALVFNDFVLRYPFKYTSAALPLVLMIAVAYNGEAFAKKLAELWVSDKGRRGIFLATIGFVVLAIMTFTLAELEARMVIMSLGALLYVLGVNQFALLRLRPMEAPSVPNAHSALVARRAFIIFAIATVSMYLLLFQPRQALVESNEYELYEFIATLPTDAFFAGEPERLSNVPTFAKRAVLFSKEIHGVEEQKLYDFFDAYYAESPAKILAFCNRYGVTHLLVNERQFEESYLEKELLFFAPQNAYIKEITEERSDFVLMHVSDTQKIFQGDRYYITACQEDAFAELNL